MFDSHCHLQDPRIEEPRAVWARARQCGVQRTVLAGVDPADWERQRALADLPGVFRSVGLHPQVVATYDSATLTAVLRRLEDELRRLLPLAAAPTQPTVGADPDPGRAPGRVVALGETGLDRVGERAQTLALQREAFAAQLALARTYHLPVILHVLRAHEEALQMLRSEKLPAEGGVVHSYSGSAELVKRYLDLGLFLSFSGSITWHERGRAAEAAARCPLDRMLIETDAPDQTPTRFRPGQSTPAHLLDVAEAVARAAGVSMETVQRATENNACTIFGISLHEGL